MTTRRFYAMTLLVMGLGGLGAVVAYGATWVTATVPVFAGEPTPTRIVELTGSMLIPFGSAAGWVGLASMAGVIATRSWGRVGIGIIAALAGAAAGVPALAFLLSRGPLVNSALKGDEALSVQGNAWWLIAALSGLAVMVSGLLTARFGRSWSAMSPRYERERSDQPGGSQDGRRQDRSGSLQMWDALDRGEDPT